MRRFIVAVFGLIVLCMAAPPALGHGVQIQVTFNPATGKIETREIVHTASRPNELTDLTRVYVMPFLNAPIPAGDGWYTRATHEVNQFNVPLYPTGPGLTFQYDEAEQLPGSGWAYSGSGTLPNLQGTNFGYLFADGLKSWTGSGWVDPGAEQVQVFRGDGTTVPTVMAGTSDSGPFANMALAGITSKSTNAHSSVSFRMLGDGTNFAASGAGAGDDGVYLLSMQFTSTASGVNASDPFYFVMFKNTPLSTALDAAASLGFSPSQVQVVPEPGSMLILAILGLLTLRGPFGGRAL